MNSTKEKSAFPISINEYDHKVYEDPFYRLPLPKAAVNYAIFSSRWDLEEISEDNILKIIHRDSGDSISLSFNSLKDKIEFVKNIYASQEVKQLGKGLELEKLANRNIKPRVKHYFETIL
jgi:hypothetical protein